MPVFIIEVIIFTVVILSILFLALLNDDFSTNLAIFLPTLGVFAFSLSFKDVIHHIYNGVASLSFDDREDIFKEAKTKELIKKVQN